MNTEQNSDKNEKALRIGSVMHRFFRIMKLRFLHNYQNCDSCNKFTNKIYSIPYIEAGLLVCKRCGETDLNGA